MVEVGSAARWAYVIGGVSTLVSFSVPYAQAQVMLKDEPRPASIKLQDTDKGVVFVDSRGMTLYSGLDPKPGVSTCTDEIRTQGTGNGGHVFYLPNFDRRPSCISKQPPALVGDDKPVGPWTVVNRPDGLKQWAYRGKPLYTSVKDYVPGDVNGVGFAYSIAAHQIDSRAGAIYAPRILPPEAIIQQVGVAQILANSAGHTLYTHDLDAKGKFGCEGRCLLTWRPLPASMTATQSGDWSVVTRADKSRQWAFKDKPVYTYTGDFEPGDYNGSGTANWRVALAHPLPPLPPVVSVVQTIIGPRFADKDGKTLYIFMCTERSGAGFEGAIELACDDPPDRSAWWTTTCGNEAACADMWRPIVADKDAKPVGRTWTIVTLPKPWSPVRAADDNAPGTKVWAYRGRPVFTFKFEDRPGMIEGQDMGELTSSKFFSINAAGSDLGDSGM